MHNTVPCLTNMTVEVLTVSDCPHTQQVLSLVNAILEEEHLNAQVNHVIVPDEQAAQVLHFPGSPTVRINGFDIQPSGVKAFGLACRVYHDGDRITGVPPAALIRAAFGLDHA